MATITGKFPSGFAETIIGTPEDDTIFPLGGYDLVDGGAGVDTVVIAANLSQFTINRSGGLVYVDTVSAASGGGDQLRVKNVERLSFTDAKVAIDTAINQSAGETLLLTAAVLGRTAAMGNKALMGVGIALFDQGVSMLELSAAVMRLPIWDTLASGNSPNQIATYLLTVVNGKAPSAGELDAAVRSLNADPQGTLLSQLALSTLNQLQADLVGVQKAGLLYE